MSNSRVLSFHSCVLLFISAQLVQSQTVNLNNLFPPDYNSRIRPASNIPGYSSNINETFTVGLSVHVNNLLSVSEASQQFSLDMTLIQEWFDSRLNISFLGQRSELTLRQSSDISKFWLPDLYFVNSRASRTISSLQTQQSITLHHTGIIEYRIRVSSSFNCHMWLINYPHDWHVCSFEVSSLRYAPNEMRIRWMDFDVNDKVEYPQQKIRSWWIDRCDNKTDRYDFMRVNSCAKGSIKLVRRISYYIIRYYLLSFLMMIVAYVGFWLPVNAWPGRANIIAAPMFSLLTIDLSMNNEVGVSYTVSLQIWMMFLQAFLYLCFVEWAFAVAWSHMVNTKKRYALVVSQSKSGQLNTMIQVPDHVKGYYFGSRGWYRKIGKWIDCLLLFVFGEVNFKADPMTRNKIDYLARIFFPAGLIFFVFMYVMLTTIRWSAHFYG